MRPAFYTSMLFLATLYGCATTSPNTGHSSTDQSTPAIENIEPTSNPLPTSSAELTQETIGKIVKSHFNELEACYEASLAADNSLAGVVELELTIAKDGTIEEGRLLKDGLGSAELNLCLVKKMIEWTFPAHKDEAVTIQFPFAFSPKR